MKMSEVGTIQGSILGPFLYAVFVSPLFDMTDFTAYADDSQVIDSGIDLIPLMQRMEQKIKIMIHWMTKSGLKVNESKTEICLFHKNDHPKIEILINNTITEPWWLSGLERQSNSRPMLKGPKFNPPSGNVNTIG